MYQTKNRLSITSAGKRFEGLESFPSCPLVSLRASMEPLARRTFDREQSLDKATSLFSSTSKRCREAKAGINITNRAVPILAPTDKRERKRSERLILRVLEKWFARPRSQLLVGTVHSSPHLGTTHSLKKKKRACKTAGLERRHLSTITTLDEENRHEPTDSQ